MIDYETRQSLKEIHFNAWEYHKDILVYFVEYMYKDLGITCSTDEKINIDPVVLQRWLVSGVYATL